MNNTTRVTINNQAWIEKSCYLNKSTALNIESYLNSFAPIQRRIINYLFEAYHFFDGNLYMSQDTIGNAVGCSTRWVVKTFKRLRQDNFMISNYHHKDVCQYKLARDFDHPPMISRLRHIFPVFKNIVSKHCIDKSLLEFRQLNIKNNYDISNIEKGKKPRPEMWGMSKDGTSFVLNDMNFTLEQKITASAFPDEGLEHAKQSLGFAKNIRNPFAYFMKVAWDWSNRNGWIPNFGWTNKLRDILGIKKSAVEKMEKISTASDEVPSIATMLAETMVAIMLEIKEDVKKILSYAELMSLCKPLMMGNNEEKKAADKLVSSIMKQLHALPEKERVEWQNQARLYKEN